MKIKINTGGRKFRIGIPNGIIFSKPSVWLYMKLLRKSMSYAEKYMPDDVDVSVSSLLGNIPEEAAYALCDGLRRIKRKHGTWQLVNVESSDGSSVIIEI